MAQASQGYFGLAQEVTEGVEVAPTHLLPVKDVDFSIDTEFIEIREIRGSRQAYSTFDGPLRPSATFTSSLYPAGGYGYVMKGLFGDVTTAATLSSATAKTHTFVDAPALKTFSFERSDARAAGGILHERLAGVKIESVGFSCNFGEDVEMSVTAQGLGFPTDPVSKPAAGLFTTGYPAMDPLIFTGATVAVDGAPNFDFKSVDFEFTNTLERQEALNGSRESESMMEGGLDCTFTGTMIFRDLVFYNHFKNSETFTVTVQFTGSNAASDGPGNIPYKAYFHWPKVKVANLGLPMTAGEVMEADVELNVSFDNATQRLVDVQFTNLDTGYA